MKKAILILLLALFGFFAVIDEVLVSRHLSQPGWWSLLSTLIISVTIFWWYRVDSTQKAFERPFILSVGVIAIAPLAIPLYVYQSTERGQRLRAFCRLLGYSSLLFLASGIGVLFGGAIG